MVELGPVRLEDRLDFQYSLIKALTKKLEALDERVFVAELEIKAHSNGLSEAPKPWTSQELGKEKEMEGEDGESE